VWGGEGGGGGRGGGGGGGGSRYKLLGPGSLKGDPGPQHVKCILNFSRCVLAGLG